MSRRFINKTVTQKLFLGFDVSGLTRQLREYRDRGIREYRDSGMSIVVTCGCFDLLHVGHARLLRAAADLGDLLVVGLNEDETIRHQKGPERPVRPLAERAEMIASLEGVSFVTSFKESDPCWLLDKLRPDIYVKGGDYAGQTLPESATVTKNGGQIVFVPFHPAHSTTALIRRLKGEKDEEN